MSFIYACRNCEKSSIQTPILKALEDGRIKLSNNRAERSIKPFVIGRKNWLFCNTPSGAKSSAVIYSIIETAKENGLNPYSYLNFIFEQIQLQGTESIDNLLPWSDNIPDFCRIKT
jgi:transposase